MTLSAACSASSPSEMARMGAVATVTGTSTSCRAFCTSSSSAAHRDATAAASGSSAWHDAKSCASQTCDCSSSAITSAVTRTKSTKCMK